MEKPGIVVIGSGFGGAVSAARLAEAGFPVTLLERGPWRDTLPVRSMGIAARVPLPRGRRVWWSLLRALRWEKLPFGGFALNRRGLFEIHLSRGLAVIGSANVGGGSHVYAGLNVRPPDPNYWDNVAAGLSSDVMNACYDRVLERMGSRSPMADDQLPNTLTERFAGSDVIDANGSDFAMAMGFLFPETPGAPRRVTDANGVERREMTVGEEGNLGSLGGGKTTLDVAYLARALRHGLKVYDQCEAQRIRRVTDGNGAYAIDFRNGHSRAQESVRADIVIVAAGTMNTLNLLLSSVAAGGLRPMPRLGERFGGNGDYFGYWHLDDKERDLSVGMPARGRLRVKASDALGIGREWPLIAEGSLPNPADLPLGNWVARKLRGGSFVAGMGGDAQDGTVRLLNGKLSIDYDPANSEIFSRIIDAFKYIGDKTGRKIFHFKTPITVHPTGGACIGAGPESGVVDASGEAFENPGLYVADGAALPKPVGGPPSITIGAWADHVAERLIARHESPNS